MAVAPHAYLTDERRLIQVVHVGEAELVCENVGAPAGSSALVTVRISDVGVVWRRVIPRKDALS